MVSPRFLKAVPALAVSDEERAVRFLVEVAGFTAVTGPSGESLGIVRRDGTEVHVWVADGSAPGAEAHLAGSTSCRIEVSGVDVLFERCDAAGVVHPNGPLAEKPWGTQEFAILDPDGNQIAFYERVSQPVEPFDVLLVSGSLREGSTNSAIVKTAAAVAPPTLTTHTYSQMALLPHFNPDDDREGDPVEPEVARMRAAVAAAKAILICTPEYAGALPGSLKNLLEWTVGDAGTYRKPVAWINASGPAAPSGGADAHDSLRKVFGFVGATIVEDACLRIPLTRDAIGEDGLIGDESVRAQIQTSLQILVEHPLEDQV